MRLVVCTLSAVLLSGCSWLGGAGNVFNGGGQGHHAKSSQYGYGAQHGQHQYRAQQDPCQVFSPQAPVPRGCQPSQVTLGTAGGFPQQPNFGGGQYASQGYGSHAGVAHQQANNYQPRKRLRKPRFRGSLSLGLEKSISGNLLDYDDFPNIDPSLNYDPRAFNEGFSQGDQASGQIVNTLYTAIIEDISQPNIAFNDAHSTPLHIKGGVEYLLSPRTTVFANAGYKYAEGEKGNFVGVNAELQRRITTSTFQTVDGIPATAGSAEVPATATTPAIPAVPATAGTPDTFVLVGSDTNTSFIPNVNIANYSYDFNNQQSIELEVGARHYFNPIGKSQGYKTLTPFIGASVGATHHKSVSFDIEQNQLFYQRAFEDGENDFFDVIPANVPGGTSRVNLFDSEWVPSGQLNAGMEWQVTPKTALAFETGVRFEGARENDNGDRGDDNIAIPVTIRGSYNF